MVTTAKCKTDIAAEKAERVENPLLAAALGYAENGWFVIPLHNPKSTGKCSCENTSCESIGKHPRVKDWNNEATIDISQIKKWWSEWPEANVGIIPGKSRLLALDIDTRHGGDLSLKELELIHGHLPCTLTSLTGGGGKHYLFGLNGTTHANKTGMKPGIDIKCNGGMIVAPPSLHISGRHYQWESDPIANDVSIAPLPDWLEKMINSCENISVKGTKRVEGKIEDGRRNSTLTSLAGSMHKRGMSKEAITAALITENTLRCEPPVEESRIAGIVASIMNYPSDNANPSETIELSFGGTIVELDHKYCRRTEKKTEPISTFLIDPQESIVIGGREHITANLISENGRVASGVKMAPEVWAAKKDFLSILPGREFSFIGTDKDIQMIKYILADKSCPSKTGYSAAGLHRHNGEWIYLTNEGALGKNGLATDAVLLSECQDYNTSLLSTPPMGKIELENLMGCLSGFNHPYIVAPILGWTIAAAFKQRLFTINKQFPLLSVFGEAGSGKTETIKQIILSIFGLSRSEKSASALTNFTLMLKADASNCFPLFLDEYKPSKINGYMQNVISNYVRSAYNNHSGDRGQKNLSSVEFKYQVPTVIAGEDQFSEIALRERIIEVQFDKERSQAHSREFKKLETFNIAGVGRHIIDYCLRLSDNDIKALFEEEERKVASIFKTRYRTNIAIARFGLAILNNMFREQTGKDFAITADDLEKSQRETLIEETADQKNVVDEIVQAVFELISQTMINDNFPSQYRLLPNVHYRIADDEIRIHLPSVYPVFNKWARDYSFQGYVISQKGFINQIKKAKYYKDHKQAQMVKNTSSTKKCIILDLKKLEAQGIETYQAISETNSEKVLEIGELF